MFVTLIRKNDHLTARVSFNYNKVEIRTTHNEMRDMLWEIYHPEMSSLEFAKANYRLNRLRTEGITWEIVLENDQAEVLSS